MHYQVPQFIEIEDKIFGPLTLKQFVYLAGGGGASLAFFTLFPLYLALPLSLPFAILALSLAFYTVNGRPFVVALEHAFKFYMSKKLYLWKQRAPEEHSAAATLVQKPPVVGTVLPQVTQSRLRDLAWSLNIKDREEAGGGSQKNEGFAI